ncbi:MAG: biosynthetic-type acetolactate synthase large subunit [Deltaproteobacteria bacterium]|nr:biosynthetic-type acetolactate synthase large subunit [Deltaproteobacteria bacterium]
MKLKGAQILFRALEAEKVDTIFGYPGGKVLDLFDELFRSPIDHILVRHEQGAAHAADAYARVSGKVGVCLVTSGPGATNTVTGIANAYLDSIPMVILTGQVQSYLLGSDAFQEADITGITRPCTKHNYLIRRIEDIAQTVKDAFHIASTGRPGPVLIDLPVDIIQMEIDEADLPPLRIPVEKSQTPTVEECREALTLLAKARRPLIFTGGGVVIGKASQELRQFVNAVRIPVTSSLMGLGAFPASDPLWLGMPGMHGTYYANMAISDCDVMLAIGVRFDDRVTSKVAAFAPNAKIIHIDIDPVTIDKIIRSHMSIIGDCKPTLQIFNELLATGKYDSPDGQRSDWLKQVADWKQRVPLGYCTGDKIKPQCVVETLYRLTKGKAIITTEVGQNQMWAAQFYHFDEPNAFITSGGLGTMGFGLPAAIGAQIARPDKLVVDVAGDGSIQMNSQELATAVNHNLPVKIVILNNGYLGMVRQWQELFYGRRYSHSGIKGSPDFVKLAEAYGATGLRTDKPEEMEALLIQGLGTPGVVVMDFHVDPEEGVYPIVKPNAPLNDMLLRAE